jgi:hypothetical protein
MEKFFIPDSCSRIFSEPPAAGGEELKLICFEVVRYVSTKQQTTKFTKGQENKR